MSTATHNVEVPFPQAFASSKRSPFPCAPRYGREHSTTIDEPTVRWVWRSCQTRQEENAIYRKCSSSAKRRIASSNTAVWERPRCAANFKSNALASGLMRMLINALCIVQLYHTLRYNSRDIHPIRPKQGGPFIPRLKDGGASRLLELVTHVIVFTSSPLRRPWCSLALRHFSILVSR